METNPMDGVSDQTITLQVSGSQYGALSKDCLRPGEPRVTHKLTVGPHYLPGTWVVIGTLQRNEPPETTFWITLAKMEE